MTIMTKEEVGAWCKEIADQINSDPILLDVFTRAYCTEEEEHMSECPKCGVKSGSHFVGSGNMPICPPKMSRPIAWLNPDPEYEQICPEIGFEATICCEQHPRDLGWIPLYAQREWVGLTEDEVYRIAFTLEGEHWKKISDAIEAKLKRKNT
jgi:hypothetical protein